MIKLLAESSKSIGHFYNVGNENEEITMGKLAQKIINLISKDIKVNPLPPTSGSPERRCPDISKLNKIISYFSLEKDLKKTMNGIIKIYFLAKEFQHYNLLSKFSQIMNYNY